MHKGQDLENATKCVDISEHTSRKARMKVRCFHMVVRKQKAIKTSGAQSVETDSLGDELQSNNRLQGTSPSACAFARGSRSSEYNESASGNYQADGN